MVYLFKRFRENVPLVELALHISDDARCGVSTNRPVLGGVFQLICFALIGLLAVAALFVLGTSIGARAVPEPAPSSASPIGAEEDDTAPLAKGDRLASPNFVVRLPVSPVEPSPPAPQPQSSTTEEVTSWHWRAGSKKVIKRTVVRERSR